MRGEPYDNVQQQIVDANKKAGTGLIMEGGVTFEPWIIQKLLNTRSYAYAPISGVKVAALALAIDNKGHKDHFNACNFEVSKTIREHAEKMAARMAWMNGHRNIEAVYVTSQSAEERSAMCPECRDYYRKTNPKLDVKIIVVNPDGSIKFRTTLKDMLPNWTEV